MMKILFRMTRMTFAFALVLVLAPQCSGDNI